MPALCAGAIATIVVALSTVKLVAPAPPKLMASIPVRFFPLIVTWMPPRIGPVAGLIPVKTGSAGTVAGPADPATVPKVSITASTANSRARKARRNLRRAGRACLDENFAIVTPRF